jgi:transposase
MTIHSQDREQVQMFNSLEELISEDNPVRLLDIIIKTILKKDKKRFVERGRSYTGRPAYTNEVLIQIYIYGYMNRIQASRRLEQETYRNIELMWLIGNLHPDHKTIADFRKDNALLIKEFTKEIRKLLMVNSLITGKTIASDGTKLKANASKDMYSKSKTIERLSQIEAEFQQFLEQMDKEDIADATADNNNEQHSINTESIEEQIKSYTSKIEELKSRLEMFERTGRNYLSPTDQDCNLMSSRDGKIPAYNVQMTTDTEYDFIADEYVTDEANDINQLGTVYKGIEEELAMIPEQGALDTGYCNLDIIEEIEKTTKTEIYVPHPKEQNQSPKIKFEYDEENDNYICSQGEKLTLKYKNKKNRNSIVNVYVGKNCNNCQMKEECTDSKEGRHISRFHNHEYREQHKERMKSHKAKEMSILRKSSIEHIFGTLKIWQGKIPLLLRGKAKVITEIKLFSTAYNIKHLMNLFTFSKIIDMIAVYTAFYYSILVKKVVNIVKILIFTINFRKYNLCYKISGDLIIL